MYEIVYRAVMHQIEALRYIFYQSNLQTKVSEKNNKQNRALKVDILKGGILTAQVMVFANQCPYEPSTTATSIWAKLSRVNAGGSMRFSVRVDVITPVNSATTIFHHYQMYYKIVSPLHPHSAFGEDTIPVRAPNIVMPLPIAVLGVASP